MESKICPMMSRPERTTDSIEEIKRNPFHYFVPCQKEKCQLWVEVWVDIKKEWRCGLIRK